jgi:hypothetical protein
VHLGINQTIEIRSFGGNSNCASVLKALVKSHGFSVVESLGIIRDAEVDANAAKQSVDYIIANSGLATTVRRSVFILPDNTNPGMIETLCLSSVSTKPHFPHVDDYIDKARNSGASFPQGLALAKSRLQVYMAAHPEPQLMPGIAASRGYWPFADPLFQDLKTFMQSL